MPLKRLPAGPFYRYFPSRDDLLTALLIICFDEVGAAVETADDAVRPRSDLGARWLAIAGAFRGWAVTHPYDFGLLYGTPVPGYAAPQGTIAPAARATGRLIGLVTEYAAGHPDQGPTSRDDALHDSLAGVREFAGGDVPDQRLVRGLAAWSGLIGAVTLELGGHLTNGVDDFVSYSAALARTLAPVPLDGLAPPASGAR